MTVPHQQALPPATPDEFLPPPGAWAHQLGWRTAAAGVALLAMACVWPLDELARASGQVRPQGENSPVQSLGGGRLSRVLVSPNQKVKAGQLLAEFDREPLLSQRRQLLRERTQLQEQLHQASQQGADLQAQTKSIARLIQTQIASARGGVAQALAGSRFQERELQRLRSLAAEGAIPQLLLEEKEAGVAVASSRLEQARLGVGEQRARLEAEQAVCANRSVRRVAPRLNLSGSWQPSMVACARTPGPVNRCGCLHPWMARWWRQNFATRVRYSNRALWSPPWPQPPSPWPFAYGFRLGMWRPCAPDRRQRCV